MVTRTPGYDTLLYSEAIALSQIITMAMASEIACWCCRRGGPHEVTGKLPRRDCSCIGQQGYAHFTCLVQHIKISSTNNNSDAEVNRQPWCVCPWCHQPFVAELARDLAVEYMDFVEIHGNHQTHLPLTRTSAPAYYPVPSYPVPTYPRQQYTPTPSEQQLTAALQQNVGQRYTNQTEQQVATAIHQNTRLGSQDNSTLAEAQDIINRRREQARLRKLKSRAKRSEEKKAEDRKKAREWMAKKRAQASEAQAEEKRRKAREGMRAHRRKMNQSSETTDNMATLLPVDNEHLQQADNAKKQNVPDVQKQGLITKGTDEQLLIPIQNGESRVEGNEQKGTKYTEV